MRDRRRIFIPLILTIQGTAIRIRIPTSFIPRRTQMSAALVLIKALLTQIRNLFMLTLRRRGEIVVERGAKPRVIVLVAAGDAAARFDRCQVVLVSTAICGVAGLAVAGWVVGLDGGLAAVSGEILLRCDGEVLAVATIVVI